MLKLCILLGFLFLVECQTQKQDCSCKTDVDLFEPFRPQSRMFLTGITLLIYIISKLLTKNYDVAISSDDILFIIGIIYGYYTVRRVELNVKVYITLAIPPLIIHIFVKIDGERLLKYWQAALISGVVLILFQGYFLTYVLCMFYYNTWYYSHVFVMAMMLMVNNPTNCILYLKRTITQTAPIISLLESTYIVGAVTNYLAAELALKGIDTEPTLYFLKHGFVNIVLGFAVGKLNCFLLKHIVKYEIAYIVITILVPVLAHYLILLFAAGSTDLLFSSVIGIVYNFNRRYVPELLDQQLMSISKLAYVITSSLAFFYGGMLVGKLVIQDIELNDVLLIITSYVIINVTRIFTFLIFSPLLIYLGYNLNMKKIVVTMFANNPSSMSIMMILIIILSENFKLARTSLCLYFGSHVFSLIINRVIFIAVLKFTGFGEHTSMMTTNINKNLMHLRSRQARAISIFKMDRNKSDVNWKVATELSKIKHAYKLPEDFTDADNILCPSCKAEIPRYDTKRKKSDLILISRTRSLMARRNIYSKFVKVGILNRKGENYMINMVDKILESNDKIVSLEEIKKKFTLHHLTVNWRRTLIHILFYDFIEGVVPKKNLLHCLSYYLLKYKIFDIILILANIYRLVIFIRNLYSGQSDDDIARILVCVLSAFEIFLFIFATSETPIYPNAIQRALRCPEIILPIFSILVIVWYYVHKKIFPMNNLFGLGGLIILWVFRFSNTCRRIIFVGFKKYLRPKLKPRINFVNISRASYALQLGTAFVYAERELLLMLDCMVDNRSIRNELKYEIQNNIFEMMKCITYICKLRDWLATTQLSKYVILLVLKEMDRNIRDLECSGWLDTLEAENLLRSIRQRSEPVHKIKYITPPLPKDVFFELIWLTDKKVSQYLYKNVVSLVFNPGDVIVNNDYMSGVYIVVTGLLKLIYNPTSKILSRLENFGELPVIDYIRPFMLYSKGINYFSVGCSFGEFSVLSNRPYSGVIVAEHNSQCLFLHKDHVLGAMQMSRDPLHGMEAFIWKCMLVKIAHSLFQHTPMYHLMHEEKLDTILDNAFVPDISHFKTLVLNEMITNIILLQGQLIDVDTKEFYIAPCYIPPTVRHFSVPPHDLDEADKLLYPAVKVLFMLKTTANAYEAITKLWNESDTIEGSKSNFIECIRSSKTLRKDKLLTLYDNLEYEERLRREDKPKPLSSPELAASGFYYKDSSLQSVSTRSDRTEGTTPSRS